MTYMRNEGMYIFNKKEISNGGKDLMVCRKGKVI